MNNPLEKVPAAPLRVMGRIGDIIEDLMLAIGSIFIVLFFVAVILDVSARTLNNSLVWTQDAAIFSYVWCIFTASAICIRRNEHFSIELFRHLPELVKKLQKLFILAILFLFAFYMVRYGWEYAILGLTRKSSSSGFRLFYAIACIPLSCAASMYFLLEQLICVIFGVDLSSVSKNIAKLITEKEN